MSNCMLDLDIGITILHNRIACYNCMFELDKRIEC